MLLLTVPIMIILAISAFLFNNFYNATTEQPLYSTSGNFIMYQNAMRSYALANLSTLTPLPYLLNNTTGTNPYILSRVPTYFNNVTYSPMGDYKSYILTYQNIKYLVSSFSTINGSGNDIYAAKTLNAIATMLQTPSSGISQNYHVKIALINSGCTANILNVGMTNSVVNTSTYSTIFTNLCGTVSAGSIKKYVLMEALE